MSVSTPGIVGLRIVGLLITAAVVAGIALGAVAQFFQQTRVETSTVTTSVARVVADADTGDIRLRAGQVGEPIRVTRTLNWSFQEPTSTVETAGNTLTVTGRCTRRPVSVGPCSVDLDVVLPPGTDVEVSTSTGDVRVTGLQGVLRATTSTGDVSLIAVGSADVQARASTGDVVASFTTAPSTVVARTSTGDIVVTVPGTSTYRVDAQTSTGDRTVNVPADAAAPRSILADSSTGDVTVRAR